MLGLLKDRSFGSLIASQFLGAFNDNAFKQLVLLLTVAATTVEGVPWVAESGLAVAADGTNQQWLPATLFALPFVLLCSFTGTLADRFSKSTIIKLANVLEIVVMGCALGAFLAQSYAALLGVVFLMGAQSALFGPSKYGIVKELVPERDMGRANALLQTTTTIAILGGIPLAGYLAGNFAGRLWIPAVVYVALATVGFLLSLPIVHQPAHAPESRVRLNPFAAMPGQWREARTTPHLVACVFGSAFYYFVGALLLLLVNQYGIHVLELGQEATSLLLVPVVVGIAVGAVLASKLSGDRIEGGLAPLGILGMAACLFAVHIAPTSTPWIATCLGLLGVASGLFALPIRTLVQILPRDAARGSVLGLSQVFDFTGILLAGPAFKTLQTAGLGAGAMFTVTGILCLVAFVISLRFAAHFTIRFVVWFLAHTVYRMRVRGLENIPERGGALLVANHLSFVDAVLVAAIAGRDVRFLMYRGFFDTPVLGWFARKMGAIPVSSNDSKAEKAEALALAAEAARSGELVCIFAEGAITRTGHTMPFAPGMETIAQDAGVPVLPVALDRLWGSIFSYAGGKVFRKLPRRLPYKVDVSVGAPLPSDTTAFAARQRIQELVADLRTERSGPRGSLAWRFLRESRRYAGDTAIVDGTGVSLSFRKLAVGSLCMRDALEGRLGDAPNVAVLLPPGAGGALANLALCLGGRTSVNLNYTLKNEDLAAMCERAGVQYVITAKRFLKALDRESPLPAERTILLEDVRGGITGGMKVRHLVKTFLPGAWLANLEAPKAPRGEVASDRVATIIYSSGSTGFPKGIQLSHANVLSNVQSVLQVIALGPGDGVLGILPFFHSFGYTVTLWATLLSGAKAVYHANPIEAKVIGELSEREGVTITIATPTFYSAYLRRCTPEQFAKVRLAVSGAQKLNVGLADAWEAKFGSRLMEGYGCTELSPVVSVNLATPHETPRRLRGHRPGSIGRPVPGVAVRIVDRELYPAETLELDAGEEGLILVKGPNVMRGYLGEPEKTADVVRDGWYTTGDIGYLDRDGFLFITDRVSRFSKIGGEMVPHGRVEETLLDLTYELARGRIDPEAEEGVPEIAVTAVVDEVKGERLAVLYTGLPFAVGELQERAKDSELPNLFLPRPDAWFEVPEIPKLGTGKVDLGGVRALAAERASVEAAG